MPLTKKPTPGSQNIFLSVAKRNRAVTTATWELTHECPWRCRHCYLGTKMLRGLLDRSQLERVLRQLLEAGVTNLALTGGEPMLHPEFQWILHRSRYYGFAVTLFSNLIGANTADLDALAAAMLDAVEVTVLGPNAQLHDALCGRKNSFEPLLMRVKHLLARGQRVVIKTVVTSENLPVIEEIRSMATALGCGFGQAWEVCHRVDTKEMPSYGAVTDKQWKEFTEGQSPTKNSAVTWPGRTEYETHFCGAGLHGWAISPTADVFPCVVFRERAGNLLEQDWQEIYESAVLCEIRKTVHDVPSACQGCSLQPHCKRCKGQAWLECGEHLAPSRNSCALARVAAKCRENV